MLNQKLLLWTFCIDRSFACEWLVGVLTDGKHSSKFTFLTFIEVYLRNESICKLTWYTLTMHVENTMGHVGHINSRRMSENWKLFLNCFICRKKLKDDYKKKIVLDGTPPPPPPSLFKISNMLCREFFFCCGNPEDDTTKVKVTGSTSRSGRLKKTPSHTGKQRS